MLSPYTSDNELSAEQLADRVFNLFVGWFTNRLLARNKLRLRKFHAAIPQLLSLAGVDPLYFIHLHRAFQMDTSISSQTDTSKSTSSQMDNEFMEDKDFSMCSAAEYESDPDHILFE
eukprot:gene10177-8083_t